MGTNPLKQGKGLSLVIQHTSVNALTTGCWLKARSRLHFADQEFYCPSSKLLGKSVSSSQVVSRL